MIQTGSPKEKLFSISLLFLQRGGIMVLVIAFLGFCLWRGSRTEEERLTHAIIEAREKHKQPKCGQSFSEFQIPLTNGQQISSQNRRGKWTLLVFVSADCIPCHEELKALNSLPSSSSGDLMVVPVVRDKPLFGSPKEAAIRFGETLNLKIPLVADSEDKWVRFFSIPPFTPYNLLLDPDLKVAMAIAGDRSLSGGSATFQLFSSLLQGVPSPLPLAQWSQFKAKIAPVIQEGQHTYDIVRLSYEKPVVLTFLTGDAIRIEERIRTLRRFTSFPKSYFFLISKSIASVPAQINTNEFIVARKASQKFFDAFRDFDVEYGPVTVLLYRGRTVFGERGNQPSQQLDAELSRNLPLTYSPELKKGFGLSERFPENLTAKEGKNQSTVSSKSR